MKEEVNLDQIYNIVFENSKKEYQDLIPQTQLEDFSVKWINLFGLVYGNPHINGSKILLQKEIVPLDFYRFLNSVGDLANDHCDYD